MKTLKQHLQEAITSWWNNPQAWKDELEPNIRQAVKKWLQEHQNDIENAIFLNNKFCKEHEQEIKIIKDIFIDELIEELEQ